MSNPTLYINNVLKRAQDGVGDGCAYATATSATPDQPNKRFTLAGLAIIADLGADTDDKFNGYILYFPASDTKYLITDWTAGTDQATTDDVPALTDTGPCEIRRALSAPDMDAAFPLHRAVNGFPSIKAKVRAANVALAIDAHLPNLIGQGGFEELSAGALPSTEQAKGKWWSAPDWAISATTPLLGSRMAVLTVPASGNKDLYQRCTGTFRKGRTYRILMKVQAVTGATADGGLLVSMQNRTLTVYLDADFGGAGAYNFPSIGTTAAWVSADFVPDYETDDAVLIIEALYANRGAATAIRVDEVYLWEVVNVASLLAFQHNWDGSPDVWVEGYRCSPSRTGIAAADKSILIDPATRVLGSEPLRYEGTAAIFPIYRINGSANANIQYEVGELLLGETFPLGNTFELGLDPQARDYREVIRATLSGAETRTLYAQPRTVSARIRVAKSADVAIWDGPFREHHVDGGEPFAAYWQGHWDVPLLLNSRSLKMPYQTSVRPDVEVEWREAL